MERFLDFLKARITDGMSVNSIVDVFEEMCAIPMEEDMILFETGTYNFTGESLFYFSLTRQVPNDEDEFYQIQVNVLYAPDSENKMFCEATWNEDLNENIFDYIRKSQAFAYAKSKAYIRTEIVLNET